MKNQCTCGKPTGFGYCHNCSAVIDDSDVDGVSHEVDKMLENHGWLCDWSVSTAERVEKLIIEQRNLIHEYSMENEKMKQLLKTILETDCLPHWAYDRGDDEESIAEMVRKFAEESK